MLYLKQSTASQSIKLGPFVDSTDGVTAETALSIANTDIKLSKAGGTMAAKNSGGGTHDADGYYTITLDATDTNTVGTLQLSCSVSGALPVFKEFHVLEEAIYDALFGASASGFDASGRVDVGSVAGQTASAAATVDFGDLATIEAVTTAIGATGSGLSAIPWNATWDAEVQSECADALAAYNAVATTDLPSNFSDLTIEVTTGLVSLSADQSGVTIGTVNTAAALGAQAKLDVNAECDTALADYDAVVPADLPTNFGSMVISGAGAVDSLVQGFLNNAIAETTADNIAANFEVFFDNGNAITTKVVNDVGVAGSGLTAQQVWEYDISSIVTTGQAGSELNDASAGGGATAGEIADAVLDEALSGHTTAGTLGKAISDTLADTNELQGDWADGGRLDLILDARASQASVDVIDGIVDSILVDTGTTIPATLATLATSSALATVDANVDAILVDTGTTIPAQITALNDLSAAEMRSAVGLAAANLDTQLASLTSDVSEPGIPGATATVPEMVATLYGMARNRIDVTSSAKTFYNDAGSPVWSKALSDNGTTYTEAEGA